MLPLFCHYHAYRIISKNIALLPPYATLIFADVERHYALVFAAIERFSLFAFAPLSLMPVAIHGERGGEREAPRYAAYIAG